MSNGRDVGTRVGAILSDGDGTQIIQFLGFGTYDGDFVPPKEVGGFNLGIPNPRLTLDNGSVVWGCECWWGSETTIQARLIQWLGQGWAIEQLEHNWRAKRNGGG